MGALAALGTSFIPLGLIRGNSVKEGLDNVISALRENKGLLHSRRDMSAVARQFLDVAFMGNYCTKYGFRADTDKHTFLLCCNPTKGDYNFYCYVKEWLDKHISRAEKRICFIDSHYKELFRIGNQCH